MSWTHDDETNTFHCVSEKHGRDLTIQLPKSGDQAVYCRECWRNCMFWILPPEELEVANRQAFATGQPPVTPRLMHYFNPTRPD